MYNYQKILDPNEKVYFFGGMHWIVMSGSFAMLLIMTFSGLMIDGYLHRHHDFARAGEEGIVWDHIWSWLAYLPWAFIAAGVFWVIGDTIRYLSTRVLITSHRVIQKSGWIIVNIEELELEEIRAAHIDQMLLGRFFGAGKVSLDARFVHDTVLPMMVKPFEIVKLIHSIRDHHLGEKNNNPAPVAHADMGGDIAEAVTHAPPSTENRDPLDFLGDTVEKAHALNVLSEDLAFLHKMRTTKEKEKTPPAKPKLVHSDKRKDVA